MNDKDQSGQPAASRRRQRGILERPRGSGIWWACYFDEQGRRHREKVGPKGLALQVYAKRKTEIAERRFFPERIRRRDVLLAEAVDDYLTRVKGRMRSYENWERYGRCWKAALPGKTLREITPGHVERYAARRRAEGLADASVNRELTFLRCVFNVAIADEKTDTNPVLRKFFVKENNQRVRYLTDEEEPRLRQEMGDEEWLKVAVATNTGLRQGNQSRLRWTEVNFDTGMITVKRSKSGESYHVPMNDEVRAILRTLPSRLRSEWVFPSEKGNTPLDAKNFLHRIFLPALKRARIQGFRWHDLRHTFASRLVMNGVDLRTVQELMGHKTIAMTLRYAHQPTGSTPSSASTAREVPPLLPPRNSLRTLLPRQAAKSLIYVTNRMPPARIERETPCFAGRWSAPSPRADDTSWGVYRRVYRTRVRARPERGVSPLPTRCTRAGRNARHGPKARSARRAELAQYPQGGCHRFDRRRWDPSPGNFPTSRASEPAVSSGGRRHMPPRGDCRARFARRSGPRGTPIDVRGAGKIGESFTLPAHQVP